MTNLQFIAYKNRSGETTAVGIPYGITYFAHYNGKPAYYVECYPKNKVFRTLAAAQKYLAKYGYTTLD